MLNVNLNVKLKCFKQTRVENFVCSFLTFKNVVLLIVFLVVTPINKMGQLRENIDTCLRLAFPFWPMCLCLSLFGPKHFKLHNFLSIACLCCSSIIGLLLKFSLKRNLLINFSKYLDVYVGLYPSIQ